MNLKKMEKRQIMILFLAGVLLLVISFPVKKKEEREEVKTVQLENDESYTEYLEEKLETILSQMHGAGDVAVMITFSSSAEQVVEKDLELKDEMITESDSQGGVRKTNNSLHGETTVFAEGENGEGSPYVTKEIAPKVEGVVVLAEGGDNAVVVKNITEAIQALFGIETHKIRIVKKGG